MQSWNMSSSVHFVFAIGSFGYYYYNLVYCSLARPRPGPHSNESGDSRQRILRHIRRKVSSSFLFTTNHKQADIRVYGVCQHTHLIRHYCEQHTHTRVHTQFLWSTFGWPGWCSLFLRKTHSCTAPFMWQLETMAKSSSKWFNRRSSCEEHTSNAPKTVSITVQQMLHRCHRWLTQLSSDTYWINILRNRFEFKWFSHKINQSPTAAVETICKRIAIWLTRLHLRRLLTRIAQTQKFNFKPISERVSEWAPHFARQSNYVIPHCSIEFSTWKKNEIDFMAE